LIVRFGKMHIKQNAPYSEKAKKIQEI